MHIPWNLTEHLDQNNLTVCPPFCKGLVQHCEVCSLCIRAGFICLPPGAFTDAFTSAAHNLTTDLLIFTILTLFIFKFFNH